MKWRVTCQEHASFLPSAALLLFIPFLQGFDFVEQVFDLKQSGLKRDLVGPALRVVGCALLTGRAHPAMVIGT